WRKPRRHPQPLQRILLDMLLESSAFGMRQASIRQAAPRRHTLYRDPELRARSQELLRQGMGVSRVARALGVDRKTAYRLIRTVPAKPSSGVARRRAADKREWSDIRDESPSLSTSELRAKFPALYARLYKSDRAWLLAHPGRGARERQKDHRVNWP